MKRNDKRIAALHLMKFEQSLSGAGKPIVCTKQNGNDVRFYYAFRDIKTSCKEESGYIEYSGVKNTFDPQLYEQKRVNFIATVLTMSIIRKAEAASILEEMTYYDMMYDLSSCWRKVGDTAKPAYQDDFWLHTSVKVKKLMVALNLIEPLTVPETKPRGRPKKNPVGRLEFFKLENFY